MTAIDVGGVGVLRIPEGWTVWTWVGQFFRRDDEAIWRQHELGWVRVESREDGWSEQEVRDAGTGE